MTRKMLTAALAVTALLVSVLSLGLTHSADAQGAAQCSYARLTVLDDCADALEYPGPFTNHPPAPTGPYGWGALNIVAATGDDAAAGGGTGGGLAHTGSETGAIAYVGMGLVAFGAVALGSRRKFFQGALD